MHRDCLQHKEHISFLRSLNVSIFAAKLQMVVAEAEKQLQFVQKDLQGVKKNQRLALQKYQKESEVCVKDACMNHTV